MLALQQIWSEARRSTFMSHLCSVMPLIFHNKVEYHSTVQKLRVLGRALRCRGPSIIGGCMQAHTLYSHKNNRDINHQ